MIQLLPEMYDKMSEGHIGWFENRQDKLRELILQLKPLSLIEIGFNMGHSCKLICDTIVELKNNDEDYAKKDVLIYVFDICHSWVVGKNLGILNEYYKGNNINLTLIVGSSAETLSPFMECNNYLFDFIEVDGDHSLSGVSTDIKNVYNKIRSGGIIYVDDYMGIEYPMPTVDEGVNCVDWCEYNIDNIPGVFWGIKK